MFALLLSACSTSQPKKIVSPIVQDEKLGTIKRFLINPSGEVNGFILVDGTQVKFPPEMAKQLVSIAATLDKVKLKGFRENKILFEAETVTNVKTKESVSVADPIPPDQAPASRKGLAEFKSHGTIRVQLLGRRGEVNGLILQNGTIVLFGPHLPHELGAEIDIGKRIDVSGYGTQTKYGQSLNAVTITNF